MLSLLEMVARAVIAVNREFVDDLTLMLWENYGNRDTVAPFISRLFGSGEYSHVYKMLRYQPQEGEMRSTGSCKCKILARKWMKTREWYRDMNRLSFALKHLRQNLPEKYRSKAYAQVEQDVALEAMLLNLLSNSNIIKLKGCRLQGPEDSHRVS